MDRTKGVNFGTMADTIDADGQPDESGWPYIPDLLPEDDWSPPAIAGAIYRRPMRRIAGDLGSVRGELEKSRPVFMITDISSSFYTPGPETIINAPAAERREATHAVIAVGLGYLDSDACYLIRNSWGERWGAGGYSWLHEDYLEPRLRTAGVFPT